MPSSVVLEARIDSFFYPGTSAAALSGIHLQIKRGEFVVVTGLAGSGKTTLCYCLAGITPKAVTGNFQGMVTIHGRDIADVSIPKLSSVVGMVSQNPDNQLFNLTVGEDVAFGPENLNLPPEEVRRRVDEALEFTGTRHLADRFSHLLSGGQAQRIVLSSVLAMGPEIFILDQPAAELDPAARATIYENIHRLTRTAGKTLIIIEDRLSDVAAYADRVILMHQGRIVRDLPPREFSADPEIADYGIRLPDPVTLYHLLGARGLRLDRLPLTVEEATELVAPLLAGRAPDAGEMENHWRTAGNNPERRPADPSSSPPAVAVKGLGATVFGRLIARAVWRARILSWALRGKETRGVELVSYQAYRDSVIHRLDPRVKALWVIAGLFFIFTTDNWLLLLGFAAVNVGLALVARIPLRVFLPLLIALTLFGIVLLVFQLLFQQGEVFWALGPIRLHTAGFAVGGEAWLRLTNLALLFVEYMMWTHPVDIALMMVRLGLPYRYAMMLGLALRFFPVLQAEAGRIIQAQQARGQPWRTVWQRLRGLVALMLPFVLRALRRTNEVAISMELRGFGYGHTRTFLRTIGMKPVDWVVTAVIMVLFSLRLAVVIRP